MATTMRFAEGLGPSWKSASIIAAQIGAALPQSKAMHLTKVFRPALPDVENLSLGKGITSRSLKASYRVNLNFPPLSKDAQAIPLPTDLAVLLVGMTARQATSPTALFHSRIAANPFESGLLAPAHGAFNYATAAALKRWKEA